MIDVDLAELYGVSTKRLNQQVTRNKKRFPEDFMFRLTKEEAESLRSQFATSNLRLQFATSSAGHGGGDPMLSSVLNRNKQSKSTSNHRLYASETDARNERRTQSNSRRHQKTLHARQIFRIVFDELKKLTQKPVASSRQIGFKGS